MIEAGQFRVPPDHPCLSGHFPGNPVVPGVVLLDFALAIILPRIGAALAGLSAAKFTRPVLPDQDVTVCYRHADGHLDFACQVDGAAVLRGVAMLA